MVVDIEKVIVKDRIRKDFGDIQELANDIKDNGLINPPVVNKNYELLAGERRLRACKTLGWTQIEVRMMDTRDAEHELEVEIAENENRKDFSRSEREEIYTKRVEAKIRGKFTPTIKEAQEQVAKEMGTSRTNMQHEKIIIDNKDLLTPSDFANWDEGRLSTNKAFQKIKAKQKEAEEENERLRKIINTIDAENIKLKMQKKDKKEVIKKVEVAPDDYEELKQSREASKKEYESLRKEYDRMADKWKQAEHEKKSLLDEIHRPENEKVENIKRSALFFCAGVANFIEKYGGYVWLTQELDNMEKPERDGYIKAIDAVYAWASQMKENVGR